MVERSAEPASSPHTCPREVLLFSLRSYVIWAVFTAAVIMSNTLPWFWRAWSLVVSLRCRENTPGTELDAEGRVCLRRVGWPPGRRPQQPAWRPPPLSLIRCPCNQPCGYPCPRLACSWWNGILPRQPTCGVSRSPREGEPWKGREVNRHRPV